MADPDKFLSEPTDLIPDDPESPLGKALLVAKSAAEEDTQ
jgi:hypothetical protein